MMTGSNQDLERPDVSVVCSDVNHPIWPWLETWAEERRGKADIKLVSRLVELKPAGNLLLLVSCHEIVSAELMRRFEHVLVIHASDLPEGKGWSPLVWQVLEGRERIVVTLLEAADKVDSGDIWYKVSFPVEAHETFPEINEKLFSAELALADFALENFRKVQPQAQTGSGGKHYPRRKPEDSRLDPDATIAEQFDVLRMADPDRYPAFVDYRGHRYALKLEKVGPSEGEENDI